MPLPKFNNESQFRSEWIAPFLSRLGFTNVSHVHGSGEQGKDFFFADQDRFEHKRFYAVQAKCGNIGAGQSSLDDLLNQVRRSFSVKLKFHKDAHDRRISAVYLMASGTISKEAREYITDWCMSNNFGENVYFLDGETLDRLNTQFIRRSSVVLRSQLVGVVQEGNFNLGIMELSRNALLGKNMISRRCRISSIESILADPPSETIIDYKVLEVIWSKAQSINTLASWNMGLNVRWSDESWKAFLDIVEDAISKTTISLVVVKDTIETIGQEHEILIERVVE